jgi:hypothetical protein
VFHWQRVTDSQTSDTFTVKYNHLCTHYLASRPVIYIHFYILIPSGLCTSPSVNADLEMDTFKVVGSMDISNKVAVASPGLLPRPDTLSIEGLSVSSATKLKVRPGKVRASSSKKKLVNSGSGSEKSEVEEEEEEEKVEVEKSGKGKAALAIAKALGKGKD